jgi:arginine decarboxylase
MVPKRVFFTKGVGRHKHELQSFELALRDADIEQCNLVYVSSIIPPYCTVVTKEKGIKELNAGEITYVVMSRNSTNEPNRYISEHHSFGVTVKKLEDHTEDLAATMLATTLGLEFDPDKAWDKRKQEYKMSRQIVRTQSIAQTAEGDKNGLWTTVIAAAVFMEDNG